jgi:hypothetical protein
MTESASIIVAASISCGFRARCRGPAANARPPTRSASDTAGRLAAFSASGHDIVLRLGGIAAASMDAKETKRSETFFLAAAPFNTLRSSILILDEEPIVRAAIAIDRELIRLERLAMSSVWERASWRTERQRLGDLVDAFQRDARLHLGSGRLSSGAPRLIMTPDDDALAQAD